MLAVAKQCRDSTAIMENLCSCFDEFLIVSSERLQSSVRNQNEGMTMPRLGYIYQHP